MFGAIIGDIVGSPYEWHNIKTKDFPLLTPKSRFTDDSVMTLAVAAAFLAAGRDASDEELRRHLTAQMRRLGRAYPRAGYGARFFGWLIGSNPQPYGSLGNGSAMRVSPAAWLWNDLPSVRRAARLSAEVTHNHPEGIKGAEAVASAIFLARTGSSKADIRAYIEAEFGYDLRRTCDDIRPGYRFDETCPGSVPEAITAFLDGESFEDVLRTAVSLGGDSDTVACIAGSIAEGFYGVPDPLRMEAYERLPDDLRVILHAFERGRARD